MTPSEGSQPSEAEAALSQSGDLFNRVLESSTDSVSINRLEDGTFVYVNDVVVERTGYSRSELIGHTPSEYEMFADPSWQATLAEQLAAKQSVGGLEGSFVSKSGELRWAEVSAQLIDLAGEPAVLSVSRDITDRKRAQLELGRRDAILEAVAFAAERFLEDEDWEKAVEEVLGRLGEAAAASSAYVFANSEREDGELLISARFEWTAEGETSFIADSENQAFPYSDGFNRWREVLASGGVIHGNVSDFPESEQRQLLPHTLSLVSVPIFVGGNWWGYLGVADRHLERDWSAAEIEALRAAAGTLGAAIRQRHTEQRLRETELTHRSLLEQIPAVVYIEEAGAHYKDLYFSPQFENWFDLTIDEALADDRLWQKLIHPDDVDRVLKESDRTNETGEPFGLEYRVAGKDGRTIWVRDESVLVEDDQGAPLYWLGVLTDMTARKSAESAKQAAEERFRTLVEHVPAITYQEVVGAGGYPDASMLYLSPQLETILGYPVSEFQDRPSTYWETVLHPDDRARVLSSSVDVTRTLKPFTDEYRVVAKDGIVHWFHEEAVLISRESSGEQLWQGVMIDVTERKRAEQDLNNRDAILEAVAFVAGRLLESKSWEECIEEVLERLGRAAGVSSAYIYENVTLSDGELAMSIRHEWDAPGIPRGIDDPENTDYRYAGGFEHWEEILGSGGAIHGPRSDFSGMERQDMIEEDILSLAVVPIFVADEWWGFLGFDDNERERQWSKGEIEALRAAAGTLGASMQRLRIERRLREAEEKHRRLVEKIPAVLYTDAIDETSTALYISPQIEELIGYTPEERVANPKLWIEHLHSEDRDRVVAESERTNAESTPFAMDYRMIARDGHTVWVRDEATLIHDEDGKPLYWQGVMIDITERKVAESELAHALHLEREAADRLRSLDEMKNTFLTAVSHDLRTPLAAVLGLAITLERDDVDLEPEESRDLAHRIAANARKLDRLVMDLLDLDRLSRGILEPKLNRTDVGFLVRKTVEEADFLSNHPVTVEAASVVASVDQAKVERIVENLLANAVRHTPAGTQVWVKVIAADEGGVLIVVEDAGLGVLSELREAVFEPFRQVAGTPVSGHSPGVGIGLSLVARFAELHGGRAWVEDRTGGGASFKVYLPDGGGAADPVPS